MQRIVLTMLMAAGAGRAEDLVPLTDEQLRHTTARIAAVQMNGNWFWQGHDDMPRGTTDQVIDYINRAGQNQVDLIVFPELLLGKFRVPCEATERIGDAAARNHVNVVVGCFEITDDEGSYGNSSLVFDRKGEIVGRYFKTHAACGDMPQGWPGRADDPEWVMDEGLGFPVFDLDFGRIGVFTCYDGYFPEPGRILSLKGAEVLVWPNARGGKIEDYLVLSEMHRNYVHMVCTNKAVGSGTMVAEWPRRIKAVVDKAEEGWVVADVDLARLRLARKNAREFYQRRPEIYREILGDYPVWRYYARLDAPKRFEERIELRPVVITQPETPRADMALGTNLSQLAIELRAPWMDGWIRLRLPETLQSNLGFHFNDHYLPDVDMRTLEPWPSWKYDERTGEWRYDAKSHDGLVFSGAARPYDDMVYLELTFRNETGKHLSFVDGNACFMLDDAPLFSHKNDLDHLYVLMGGACRPLSSMTPTPQEKGRSPWIIMRTQERKDDWKGGADSSTWWLLDQVADTNLMMATSKDGKYLVAYAWDYEPVVLMSNCGHPCFHTGPAPVVDLAPGESATRRGIVYFMENKPEALLERFKRDQATWRRWPKRPQT